LAEDGLDHLFSQAIPASSPGAADLVGHRPHQRLGFQNASGGRIRLAVADTAGREIGRDPTLRQGGEVGFGGEAGVGRDLARLAAEIGFDLVDQRDEGGKIGRLALSRWATMIWRAASTAIWPL
jgi:hypothetical protein